MKKIIFVFIFMAIAFFATSAIAQQQQMQMTTAEEHLQQTVDGVSVTDTHKTIKMMVPVPGASGSEVKAIVKGELKTLDGKIDDAVSAAKNAKTSADAIGKNVGELAVAMKNNADATTRSNEYIRWIISNIPGQITKNVWLVCALMIIGFLGLACMKYYGVMSEKARRRNDPVTLDQLNLAKMEIVNAVDDVKKEVLKVPTLVKQLDPFTFSFESRGHQVTCTPSIDGGAYNSFHVPTSVKSKVADPSKIKRSPTTSQGELRRDTLKLLSDFFDGKFDGNDVHSEMQKDLIAYVQKTGELVIA